MSNPSKMFEMIRLYPKFASHPTSGKVGEIYYNTTVNSLYICISSLPLKWSQLGFVENGTTLYSLFHWDGSSLVENPEMLLNNYDLYGAPDSTPNNIKAPNMSISAPNKTAGTGDGGDLILNAGTSAGGTRGKIILNGNVIDINANLTVDPPTGLPGEIYYNTIKNRFRYYNGASWSDLGSGTGLLKVAAHDYSATSLTSPPANTAPYTIDGYVVQNEDLVLFTNLTTGNNRVYKANISGTTITWTVQDVFNGNINPSSGDMVVAANGNLFGLQVGKFDGTEWQFNDKIRGFIGEDFWEQSGLYTSTINNNQVTPAVLTSFNYSGSENVIIDYSISRGIAKETGQIYLTTDGTSVAISNSSSTLGSTGVTFSADIFGSLIRLLYTSTNTGSSGTFKFSIKRWSNAPGGPSGVPSYTGGGTFPAAGTSGDIQFNASGILAGNSSHKINTTDGYVTFGDLQYKFTETATILDNQTSPTVALLFPITAANHAVFEYSISRNGNYRTGRFQIAHDGTNVAFFDDYVETNPVGVSLSADISGGNIRILYTSTNTGFNGSLKTAYRRW